MPFLHFLQLDALFRGQKRLHLAMRLAKDLVDALHRLIACRLQLRSGAIDYG